MVDGRQKFYEEFLRKTITDRKKDKHGAILRTRQVNLGSKKKLADKWQLQIITSYSWYYHYCNIGGYYSEKKGSY